MFFLSKTNNGTQSFTNKSRSRPQISSAGHAGKLDDRRISHFSGLLNNSELGEKNNILGWRCWAGLPGWRLTLAAGGTAV